jgi:hypothetical protein
MSIIVFCINIRAVQPAGMLNLLQGKVDRFLCSFYYPSLCRKWRRFNWQNWRNVDIYDLRNRCNLLSIIEISELSLLKYAFKYLLKKCNAPSSSRRSWPIFTVPKHRTTLFSQSVDYRSILSWNKIPRSWDSHMSYSKFVNNCREFILGKRRV